jgi:type III secretory pathway component EscT
MNEADASAVFGFLARSSDALTFADVNVVPSWNLTPLRSYSVSVLLPLLNFQLVARSGVTASFASYCTSVS